MRIEVETKLNVGDFVVAKAALEELKLGTSAPRLLYVEEVKTVTCAGGMQIYYALRTQEGSVATLPEGAILLVDADVLELIHGQIVQHRKEQHGKTGPK